MLPVVTANDLWIAAQTAWGEARGEGSVGLIAVLEVIRNRQLLHPRWQGQSLAHICKARFQFSCWNTGDANRPILDTVTLSDAIFCTALQAAVRVFSGQFVARVGAATHYHADTMAAPPAWARGQTPCAHINHHLFFANIP